MLRRKLNQNEEDLKDLGFGSKVTERSKLRLLNHDGSFNVRRAGVSFLQSLSFYHSLLTMPWWRFHLTIFASFAIVNAIFAAGFMLLGQGAISGVTDASAFERFLHGFFLSVHTFTTVGYGHLSPSGIMANLWATLDAFVGLLGFALATGLLFARFSRPTARVIYSDNAIIAPYKKGTALEFRVANERNSQLIEVEMKVLYAQMEQSGGRKVRRFYELELERRRVAFMPLHWTVVHPIDEKSPLYGLTESDLMERQGEILILITAVDEIYSQKVHSRSSYRHDEIVWEATFKDMFIPTDDDIVTVDLRNLHKIEEITDTKKPLKPIGKGEKSE